MCIIYFALNVLKDYPLILIANRDEFYDRPSAAATFWQNEPDIYGGRDLVAGGTWLGVTRGGRFAAITNYRDPNAPKGSRSRGELVADFLRSDEMPLDYLNNVAHKQDDYSGFNLLVGECSADQSWVGYFSNRAGQPRLLDPGIYGLSNHLLDTPWPKVRKGKERFAELIGSRVVDDEQFLEILSDHTRASDHDLPATGLSYEAEKALSAIFIETPDYGTRCSTTLRFDRSGEWKMNEKIYV